LATPSSVDPVFAAIERHKAACAEAWKLSDLWGDLRGNDPEYDAVGARHSVAFQMEKLAITAVLSCPPTTIAGVIAVLAHLGQMEWLFGDNSDETTSQGPVSPTSEKRKCFQSTSPPRSAASSTGGKHERDHHRPAGTATGSGSEAINGPQASSCRDRGGNPARRRDRAGVRGGLPAEGNGPTSAQQDFSAHHAGGA
jgi:hypothetical protein